MPKDVNAAVATIKTKRTIQFVDWCLSEDRKWEDRAKEHRDHKHVLANKNQGKD